tara:strand:+ start:593 stop:811 length:219 start_codon:yes stop_codon:yes gene_type:complete
LISPIYETSYVVFSARIAVINENPNNAVDKAKCNVTITGSSMLVTVSIPMYPCNPTRRKDIVEENNRILEFL